ncbi:hypothetical protein D3C86_1317240 [compost metagenome]
MGVHRLVADVAIAAEIEVAVGDVDGALVGQEVVLLEIALRVGAVLAVDGTAVIHPQGVALAALELEHRALVRRAARLRHEDRDGGGRRVIAGVGADLRLDVLDGLGRRVGHGQLDGLVERGVVTDLGLQVLFLQGHVVERLAQDLVLVEIEHLVLFLGLGALAVLLVAARRGLLDVVVRHRRRVLAGLQRLLEGQGEPGVALRGGILGATVDAALAGASSLIAHHQQADVIVAVGQPRGGALGGGAGARLGAFGGGVVVGIGLVHHGGQPVVEVVPVVVAGAGAVVARGPVVLVLGADGLQQRVRVLGNQARRGLLQVLAHLVGVHLLLALDRAALVVVGLVLEVLVHRRVDLRLEQVAVEAVVVHGHVLGALVG